MLICIFQNQPEFCLQLFASLVHISVFHSFLLLGHVILLWSYNLFYLKSLKQLVGEHQPLRSEAVYPLFRLSFYL